MPVRFLSFSNDSALCADAVRSYTKNWLVRTLSPSINLFVGDYAASNRIEDLADQSEGIRRVAICRMDVDNLGQAFIAGFEQPDQTDPVQRMKYVNLFRAAAEQAAALEDEAKKLPGKNGAALFDAMPDHTYGMFCGTRCWARRYPVWSSSLRSSRKRTTTTAAIPCCTT